MSRLALIVEDSEACAETLQIALELIEGLEVRIVGSPRAAIATMHESEIVAIITDLHLPH